MFVMPWRGAEPVEFADPGRLSGLVLQGGRRVVEERKRTKLDVSW